MKRSDRPVGWGGNNIPDSYLRRFDLHWGKVPEPDQSQAEPEDESLAQFIREQL